VITSDKIQELRCFLKPLLGPKPMGRLPNALTSTLDEHRVCSSEVPGIVLDVLMRHATRISVFQERWKWTLRLQQLLKDTEGGVAKDGEGKDDDLVFLGTIIPPPPEIKRLKKGAASSWQLAALTDTELQVSGEGTRRV
jgi:hypothetical protein